MAEKKIKTEKVTPTPAAEIASVAPVTPDKERQARWEAFLEKASTQNATFQLQKERGEFDKIPDSFQ